MPYKVSNLEKKRVTEIEIWKKGDQYLKRTHGWRWGYWLIEDRAELDDYDPEAGIDMNLLDGELLELDDGQYEEWEYPQGMSAEDQEALEQAWEEDWHEGITNLGWEEWETEVWVTGPLEITEVQGDEGDA
jgi:hypothetical protein